MSCSLSMPSMPCNKQEPQQTATHEELLTHLTQPKLNFLLSYKSLSSLTTPTGCSWYWVRGLIWLPLNSDLVYLMLMKNFKSRAIAIMPLFPLLQVPFFFLELVSEKNSAMIVIAYKPRKASILGQDWSLPLGDGFCLTHNTDSIRNCFNQSLFFC